MTIYILPTLASAGPPRRAHAPPRAHLLSLTRRSRGRLLTCIPPRRLEPLPVRLLDVLLALFPCPATRGSSRRGARPCAALRSSPLSRRIQTMSSSLRSRVLRSTPQVDLPDAALSLDDCVASFYDDVRSLLLLRRPCARPTHPLRHAGLRPPRLPHRADGSVPHPPRPLGAPRRPPPQRPLNPDARARPARRAPRCGQAAAGHRRGSIQPVGRRGARPCGVRARRVCAR